MGFWVAMSALAVLLLVVVLVALWGAAPQERGSRDVGGASLAPAWSPDQPLADPVFPLTWQGYDPEHVDAWVLQVRRAHAAVWDALSPEEAARVRASLAPEREPEPVAGPVDAVAEPTGDAIDPS